MSAFKFYFARAFAYNLSALEFSRPQNISRIETLILLALHALGLTLLAQLARVSLLWVWLPLGVFVVAAFLPRARELISPALLAPFWFVYAAMGARLVWLRFARGDVPGYFEYALPDLRALLRFEFLVAAALCYASLIFLTLVLHSRGRAFVVFSLGCASVLSVWAAAEFFGHRAFGATGSDPYAYVQMGVDLVTRGTFAHRFALFPLIVETDLKWFPILHVGYRLPYNALGDAITVWSPGGAVAFALAYALGGENAMYWVNPFFSVASALVSALLAWELTRNETRAQRIMIAAFVCALLLTSREIVNWAGVTMVDTQALVFSTLAFYFALRVWRGGAWHWALLAGICWGAAYQVRHTQLVIVLGMLPLFFYSAARARNFALLFSSAFIVALPDLWYHHVYLGSWLAPESQELALFAWNAIAPTFFAIGQSALVAAEFGWVCLFTILGSVLYARRARIQNIALWLWFGAALAIHLPYAALRLRDLIPQFPIVAFFTAFGIVAGARALWMHQRVWATFLAAILIFFAFELSIARVWNTLPRVLEIPPARFGAMTQAQREAFNTIARVTAQNAIVGASLNSGAVDLYAQRDAFRPADWSAQELNEFIVVTQGEGRALYVLEDNAALSRVLADLRAQYRVERVADLDVPLFGEGPIAQPGALWKISR